jgi:shikimate kinase
VAEAVSQRNRIIAVGGGAVLDERNTRELKKRGVVYLLTVSPGEAARRAGTGEERPLLGVDETEIEELIRSREPAYLAAADMVLDTTELGPRDVALGIVADFDKRAAKR